MPARPEGLARSSNMWGTHACLHGLMHASAAHRLRRTSPAAALASALRRVDARGRDECSQRATPRRLRVEDEGNPASTKAPRPKAADKAKLTARRKIRHVRLGLDILEVDICPQACIEEVEGVN